MKRSAMLVTAAAIVTVVLYPWLYRYMFGLGSVYLLTPGLLHGARHLGGHAALMLLHVTMTFLLALVLLSPLSVVIALVFRGTWRPVALAAAAWLIAPDVAAIPEVWEQIADPAHYVWVLSMGLTSVFTALLGLTYLASRLTANSRWRV